MENFALFFIAFWILSRWLMVTQKWLGSPNISPKGLGRLAEWMNLFLGPSVRVYVVHILFWKLLAQRLR